MHKSYLFDYRVLEIDEMEDAALNFIIEYNDETRDIKIIDTMDFKYFCDKTLICMIGEGDEVNELIYLLKDIRPVLNKDTLK